jgi:uncharacterized protein YjdB
MKKLRKLIAGMLLFAFTALSTLPLTNDIHTAQAASSVYINDKDFTLELDHYKTIRVKGTSQKPSFYSKNSKVATVSNSGRVTAKGYGSTTIAVKVAGKTITCKVTVVQMNKKNLTLTPGESFSLVLWGSKNPVTWTSSNKKIATVSKDGKVTAKATGTAVITASVDGRDITSKVSVVELSDSNPIMEINGWSGNVKTLEVLGSSKSVTWVSSNDAIATVTSKGRILAKRLGSVTITAKVDGKKLTAKVKILDMNTREVTLKPGETYSLKVLGTSNKVTWDSYKKSVAVVDQNGTVTAQSEEGQATIVGLVDGRIIRSRITVTK